MVEEDIHKITKEEETDEWNDRFWRQYEEEKDRNF